MNGPSFGQISVALVVFTLFALLLPKRSGVLVMGLALVAVVVKRTSITDYIMTGLSSIANAVDTRGNNA